MVLAIEQTSVPVSAKLPVGENWNTETYNLKSVFDNYSATMVSWIPFFPEPGGYHIGCFIDHSDRDMKECVIDSGSLTQEQSFTKCREKVWPWQTNSGGLNPISTVQVTPHKLPWKHLQRLGPFPSVIGQLISAMHQQDASWGFTPLT